MSDKLPDLQAFEEELADYFADHDTSDLEDWATSKFANGMEHFAAAYELARRQRVREGKAMETELTAALEVISPVSDCEIGRE